MTSADNRVLLTILNYGGPDDTLAAVDSVLKQTYAAVDIYVIENGSGDDSVERLEHLSEIENVTFHIEPVNLGFAGGVNVGINYAIDHDYPYVALLNNDATLSRDWLEILINTIEKHSVSSAGGLLLNRDGATIDSTGDCLSIWGVPFPRQRDEPTNTAATEGLVFNATAGACVYRTDLFKDIGLFDEKFFAYFEDTDIGIRAQLAGHTSYYQPAAIAYHEHGSTSRKIPGFTVKQTFQNLPIMIIKDIPLQLIPSVWPRFFVLYWLLFLRAIVRGQASYALRGLMGSFMRYPHAFRERSKIQKTRVVSIDYLRSIIHPALPPQNKRTLRKMFGRSK